VRGLGGFVRSSWDEVNEIIAAANVYTIKKYGPDRVIGFSPIPAMSMVSYAAGSRYLSLIGGVCMSFYDWYCDLPPASPQVWGEQTDVPESADWYNSNYIIAWGSNVPQTRTPDAHFFTEVRYKGTKTVAVTPDYSEVAKLSDIWMNPKQGTDAAVAMAMGHVILKEFYFPDGGKQRSAYFDDYVRRYTDMPMLVMLKEHTLPRRNGDGAGPLRARLRLRRRSARTTIPNGRPSPSTTAAGGAAQRRHRLPLGGGRKPTKVSGTWKPKSHARSGRQAQAVAAETQPSGETAKVAFPYFGGIEHEHFPNNGAGDVLVRTAPCRLATLGRQRRGNAGRHRLRPARRQLRRRARPAGRTRPRTSTTTRPTRRPGRKRITGTPREQLITVARQFADNADKTQGRSMVIIGAAMNHWYHWT
jgi:nitrate reductase alpha subunit